MRRRVRDILATNYVELLGIPPSAPARDLRRYLQKAEMECEMGVGSLSHELIEAAKVELSTSEVALEYRVLARWGGDPQLAPWAGAHDRVLAEMRAPRVPPVEVCRQWLQAHTDPALDQALGIATEQGNEPLAWVGDVAGDYLSAVLVPGQRAVQAWDLATIDFGGHRGARDGLWNKLIDCLRAEIQELEDVLLRPDALKAGQSVDDARLAGWYRRAERLVDEVVATQGALRQIERRQGEPLPAELTDGASSLGIAMADVVSGVAVVCVKADCYRAALAILERARAMEAHANRAEQLAGLANLVAHLVRQARGRDRSSQLFAARDLAGRAPQSQEFERPSRAGSVEERRREHPAPAGASSPQWTQPARTDPYPGEILKRAAGWAVGIAVVGGLIIAGIATSETEEESDYDYVYPTATPVRMNYTPAAPVFQSFSRGDCLVFNSVSGAATRVSCTSPGAAKVLAVVPLKGLYYPSESSIANQAELHCPRETKSYLFPTRDGWLRGDTDILCLDR